MTAANFAPSLKRVLVHEGGYSNHKADPGGATMKGVTQKVYDAFRRNVKKPAQSVRFIDASEIGMIYKLQYWDAVHGDDLPLGVDYVVFDGGVNSGPGQSLKWLQKALAQLGLYKGRIDGIWGEGTKQAVAAVNNHDDLIVRICAIRMAFLKALKHWSTFGDGWTTRVRGVLAAGQALATGDRAPVAVPPIEGSITPKATIDTAVKRPTKAVADAAIGSGVSIAGAAQGLQEAIEQLTPLAASSGAIGNLVAYLTVGGIVLTFVGIGWRFWQKQRESERVDALNLEVAA